MISSPNRRAVVARAVMPVEPLEDRRLMSVSFSLTPKAGTGFDFGSINQGKPAVSRVFTLKNTGTADEVVNAQTVKESGFQIQTGLSNQALPPGATLDITVSLSTDQPGLKVAEMPLFITDNPEGPTNLSAGLALTGYVVPISLTDVKTVGTTPKGLLGTADISRSADAAGFFTSAAHEQVVRFALAGQSNDLLLSLSATDVPNPADADHSPGDLQIVLARDANGNGLLDRGEYGSSLLNNGTPMQIVSGSGKQALTVTGLPPGKYFVNLAAIGGFSGDGSPIAVDYDLDLSATSIPPADAQVAGMSVAIPNGDTTPVAADGTDFGFVAVGAPGPKRTFAVTNTGGTTLTLGAVTATGGFDVVSGLPASLAPGATANFILQFTATASGTYSGTVKFATNAAGKNPYAFAVRGVVAPTGTPGVDVQMGTSLVSDGQSTPADFGTVLINSTAAARTFTVTNTGDAALTLSGLTLPPGFTLADALAPTLQPGQADSFQVLMNTSNLGTFGGTISFNTNAPGSATFDFPVTGVVSNLVGSNPPEIQVELDSNVLNDGQAGTIDFGTAGVGGGGVSRTFTVTNTGGQTLTLGTPTLPAGFTIEKPPAAELAPGASDTFTVRLDAVAPGTFGGTVSFTTNDPAVHSFDISVSGTISAQPAVSVTALSTGKLPPAFVGGTKAARSTLMVMVRNNTDKVQSGTVVTRVLISADGSVDAQDVPAGQVSKKLKLKPGQSKALKIKGVFGVPPADGSFHLLAASTFNAADIGTTAAPASIQISRPRVAIDAAVVGAGPAQTFQPGRKTTLLLPIVNHGNVPAKGRIAIDLLATADGSTNGAAVLATLSNIKISLSPGGRKTLKVKFTFPATLPSGIDPASFTLIARLAAVTAGAVDAATGTILTSTPASNPLHR